MITVSTRMVQDYHYNLHYREGNQCHALIMHVVFHFFWETTKRVKSIGTNTDNVMKYGLDDNLAFVKDMKPITT
jgi:hypothetical protein